MHKLLQRGLAALGLAALASCATVSPPQAAGQPAMWQVADQDTTIYLFGTIHMLPPNSAWRTPAFEQAVASSQGLFVETIVDEANPQQLAAQLAQMGLASGLPPLAQRVPAEKRAMLETAIAKTGVPRPLFDRMETWAAAFTLLGVQFKAIGVEGEHGVESVLRNSFAKAGKPVGELESNRDQLSMFDTLPESAQRALLEGAIETPDAVRVQFDDMLAAWLRGDVEAIAKTFNEDLAQSPELMDALIRRRNANWSRWIEQRMAAPGTVMVAVGAGHLAGDGSVQRFLQQRGLEVTRIQ
jgi:uncharacterized protein